MYQRGRTVAWGLITNLTNKIDSTRHLYNSMSDASKNLIFEILITNYEL